MLRFEDLKSVIIHPGDDVPVLVFYAPDGTEGEVVRVAYCGSDVIVDEEGIEWQCDAALLRYTNAVLDTAVELLEAQEEA